MDTALSDICRRYSYDAIEGHRYRNLSDLAHLTLSSVSSWGSSYLHQLRRHCTLLTPDTNPHITSANDTPRQRSRSPLHHSNATLDPLILALCIRTIPRIARPPVPGSAAPFFLLPSRHFRPVISQRRACTVILASSPAPSNRPISAPCGAEWSAGASFLSVTIPVGRLAWEGIKLRVVMAR